MKRNTFHKLFIIFLAVLMVFSCTAVAVVSAAESGTEARGRYIMGEYIPTPEEQVIRYENTEKFRTEQYLADILARVKELERPQFVTNNVNNEVSVLNVYYTKPEDKSAKAKKQDLEKTAKVLQDVSKRLPDILACFNGEASDLDKFNVFCNIATTIASYCGPYGAIASGAIGLINTVFNMLDSSDSPTDPMLQMEDRLTQGLKEIQTGIEELQEEINQLSAQMDEATATILTGVEDIVATNGSARVLTNFMLRTEGNFSYNAYKNYIYGGISGNAYAATAYYAQMQRYAKGGNVELEKKYRDLLYAAIMESQETYLDYLTGGSAVDGKSIVQHYYDLVSAKPELIGGKSPEYAALLFASDLYQTELKMDQIVATLNFGQYLSLLLEAKKNPETRIEDSYYEYGTGASEFIPYADLKVGESGYSVATEKIQTRIANVEKQLVKDIAYILNLGGSYLVNPAEGDIHHNEVYEIVNKEQANGYVLPGQTVYINKMPQEVCDLFGFDINNFTYKVNGVESTEIFTASWAGETKTVTYYYNTDNDENILLDSINFVVGNNPTQFNGGSGTAEDPYLIASAYQFRLIANGMDKHYRLISNIDLNHERIYPLGQKVYDNGTVYWEEFTGSLDGNGYTLSNVTVEGCPTLQQETMLGLFGVIGTNGEVANLKLYNAKVLANITSAQSNPSNVYAGIIAGKNKGVIKYCSIDSNGEKEKIQVPYYNVKELLERVKEEPRYEAAYKSFKNMNWDEIEDIRSLIAKMDSATAEAVKEDKDDLEKWKKEFAKEKEVPTHGLFVNVENQVKNRNIFVYTGGIAGENSCAIFCCSVANSHISSKSTHNFGGDRVQNNKNAVYVGGVCGKHTSDALIAYTSVDTTVKITSYAKSICNKDFKPYVTAYAGGVAGNVEKIDVDMENVFSDAEVVHNYADGFNKTGAYTKFVNCSNIIADYIAHPTESDFNRIISTKETITGHIAQNTADCSVEVVYSNLYKEYENAIKITEILEDGTEGLICNAFKTEGVQIKINGEVLPATDYEIIDVYGFYPQNETFTSINQTVAVLFKATVDDKPHFFVGDVEVTIKPNEVTSVEVQGLNTVYVTNETAKDDQKDSIFPENLNGLILKYNYTVGAPCYVEIEAGKEYSFCSNCKRFTTGELECCNNPNVAPVSAPQLTEASKEKLGNLTDGENWVRERELQVSFNGETITFTINVVCDHGYNFTNLESGYEENKDLSQESTCTELGYKAYQCGTCGDVQKYYLPKKSHGDSTLLPNQKAATCTLEGYTGDKCCAHCEEVIEYGETILTIDHAYKPMGEGNNNHICENCGSEEAHHDYSISQTSVFDDDRHAMVTKYIKTCVCGDTEELSDNEAKPATYATMPRIQVSDGYVLPDQTEVVVYVQLLNNPGIKAGGFGIRYDNGLVLKTVQDGNVVEGSFYKGGSDISAEKNGAVQNGYNFLWIPSITANVPFNYNNGNVLKLTFTLPKDKGEGTSYNINLVYNFSEGSQAGFIAKTCDCDGCTCDGTTQYFLTESGKIRVVGHLPGDINGDDIVNIIDVAYIGNKLVTGGSFDDVENKEEGDVDFSGGVGEADMVAIVENMLGGFGTNLIAPKIDIKLVNGLSDVTATTNEESFNNGYITVTPKDTYGDKLPTLQKAGYKFLGWSYKMVAGKGELVKDDAYITYNVNQYNQTLYAQWEQNSITFNIGDATNNPNLSNPVYSGSTPFPPFPTFEKKYTVTFTGSNESPEKSSITVSYSLDGYQVVGDQEGKEYDEVGLCNLLNNPDCGAITVTPVFKTPDTTSIVLPTFTPDKGYKFVEWKYDDTVINTEGEGELLALLDKEQKDIELTASVQPITFQVFFDPNGGTFENLCVSLNDSPSKESYTVTDSLTISYSSAKKTGYTLKGWNVEGDKDKDYIDGKKPTISNIVVESEGTTVVFKAAWEPIRYSVSFNENKPANASSKVENCPSTLSMCAYGESYSLPDSPSLTGWEFEGWYKDGNKVPKIENLTDNNSVTLYANWVPKTVTIRFNANGGTAVADQPAKYDFELTFPTAPTRTGYTFIGWFLEQSGGSEVLNNLKVTKTAFNLKDDYTTTLYAHWVQTSFSWVDPNGVNDGNLCNPTRRVDATPQDNFKFTAKNGYDTAQINEDIGPSVVITTGTFENYDYDTLKGLRLTTVTLTIEFCIDEIDDGYQEIYFYKGKASAEEKTGAVVCAAKESFVRQEDRCYDTLCPGHDRSQAEASDIAKGWKEPFVFETPGNGDEKLQWHTHCFTFEFKIDDLLDSEGRFTIGFGSFGEHEDDYYVGKLKVDITISQKEEQKVCL